ncbi:hypothetical protein DFH09DRAFT_1356681 [Mycena vulgaris]|nr:hypothetical protein DFH09DRAFT_1356681 [Mycena vulgaris]
MSSSLTGARMSYAAAIVGCVTFGYYFVLAAVCIHFLLKRPGHSSTSRHVILGYTCLMLVVNTVYLVAASQWSEIEFVESSENPAIFAAQLSTNYAIIKHTAYIVNIWLADSLMIYRAYIIWRNIPVLVVPIVIYCGVIGLMIETGKPGGTFGAGLVVPFGTSFWSTSVALNVIVTLLISIKLLRHHRRLKALQITRAGRSYPDIVALLVESAALYSICGLIYIPLFAINTPLQYPFSALLASAAGIALNLIIFRIAIGAEFKGESEHPDSSSITFSPISNPTQTDSVRFRSSTALQSSVMRSSKTARILGESIPNLEFYALESMKSTATQDMA